MVRSLLVVFVMMLVCAFRCAQGHELSDFAAKTFVQRSFQSGGVTCYVRGPSQFERRLTRRSVDLPTHTARWTYEYLASIDADPYQLCL